MKIISPQPGADQKTRKRKGEESGPSEFAKAAGMGEAARRVLEESEWKRKKENLGFKGKKR